MSKVISGQDPDCKA